VFASVGACGCTSSSSDDAASTIAQDLRGPHRIVHPEGVYFADVNANGTGCPAGTWDVGISDDGETFTLRFNAYQASVSPGQQRDVKDCQIDIDLGSPEGLSYSVASFYYQGYVLLEKPGMTAQQTASYAFRGKRENAANRNEVAGPADDSYVYSDDIEPNRRVWSPCRRDDALHVRTRLVVKNDPHQTGSGYIDNTTVDGSLSFKWKLDWRRCHN
jgi:hypothetical protein